LNKLLSQDEVDALLKGLDSGDIGVDESPLETGPELEAPDWVSQGANIRGSMPLLEVVNNRYSQRLKGSLSSILRKMVDINPDPISTIKFSEFQRSLPVPTSMHLFKIEPLRGTGILVLESILAFSLVEAYFGGTGIGSTKIEGRDFTSIEKRVIEKVVQEALVKLMEAWEDVHPIKTEFIRSESNPLVVNVFPGEELLLSSKFEVELNKPLGTITVCIPISSIQSVRHKLSGGYRSEELEIDQIWLSNLKDRILKTQVGMNINLGRTTLSVRDLLNLKEGDIILLDKDFQDALMAYVEGIPKYEGYVGRFKNKKVFRVERPLSIEN